MRGAGVAVSRGRVCVVLLALLASACGGRNGAVRAAEQNDERALRSELLRARAEGRLNQSVAQSVARALLEGELERSRGPDGVALVETLPPCADELRGSLEDRSRTHDDVGGAALLMLVELGREQGRARAHEDDPVPSFRSAWARSLTGEANAERRLSLYADPDQRVRRAALDAAFGSASPDELLALNETARLDPDPLCRSKALRLIGTVRDPKSLAILLDRYASAPERERLSVLEGIREQANLNRDAQDELFAIAVSATGLVRLSAALLLLASTWEPPLDEGRKEALQNSLFEFARSGSPAEQVLAFQSLTPNTQETRELLEAGASSKNEEVRGRALELLLNDARSAKKAETELLTLAAEDSTSGRAARSALAERGKSQVLPFLLKDTARADAEVRLQAAHALLALGRWDHAGLQLADRDQKAQLRLACTMLARE